LSGAPAAIAIRNRLTERTLIGRSVVRQERHRETADQTLGTPVEFGLPAEL
jgi:hypothetical protein